MSPNLPVSSTQADVATTPSPCRGVCQLDADRICLGCGRSIDEIARWRQMSNEERQTVLMRLAERA